MVTIGNYLMFGCGLLMLALGLLGYLNTLVILIPMTLFSMGSGFALSNSFAGAFHPFPTMSGSAGALFGCIQILGAALASALISQLPQHNQIPLAILLSTLGALSILFLQLTTRKALEF